jgi:hypothetical protein
MTMLRASPLPGEGRSYALSAYLLASQKLALRLCACGSSLSEAREF